MIEKKLEGLMNDFWTTLEEVVADVYNAIYPDIECDILDANREYIVVGYEDDGEDVQVEIRLGGTERTITVESFEEVYRG